MALGDQAADRAAHFAHLSDVDDDGGDANDVVVVGDQFSFEDFAGGKVQDRGGGGDVLLDHEDAPGAVKHAQGERPLLAGHLIVVQLHGVDLAAAELVVLSVRAENRREENARSRTFGMLLHFKSLSAEKVIWNTLSITPPGVEELHNESESAVDTIYAGTRLGLGRTPRRNRTSRRLAYHV